MPHDLNADSISSVHLIHLLGLDRESPIQIAEFLKDGLDRGEGALVVAEPQRTDLLQAALTTAGLSLRKAFETGSLVFRDAEATLQRFMVDGMPDETLFQRAVGELVRDAQAGRSGLRIYGEMVGVLWRDRNAKGAVALEVQWNGLLNGSSISLLCGYPIDIFGREFTVTAMDEVLREHTCMLPAFHNGALKSAVDDAIREVLGTRAESVVGTVSANFRPSWAAVPSGEATILWLRKRLPEYADEILLRARRRLVPSEV
jgi:hypothetical protein